MLVNDCLVHNYTTQENNDAKCRLARMKWSSHFIWDHWKQNVFFFISICWILRVRLLGNTCMGEDHFAVTNIGNHPDVKWAPARSLEPVTGEQWKHWENLRAIVRKQLTKVKISQWSIRPPKVGGAITERDERNGAWLVSGCKCFIEH